MGAQGVKVKVLKSWICGGRVPEVGSILELPDELARSGIERGLCRKVKKGRKSISGRSSKQVSGRR